MPLLECSETYQYYSLPFCEPSKKSYETQGLGQVLAGDRVVNSLYVLNFGQDSEKSDLCKKLLTKQDVAKFRNAVASEYYFQVSAWLLYDRWACSKWCTTVIQTMHVLQMYFDELPIWGFLGKIEKNFRTEELSYFLFTHFHFDVAYNGNRVIGVNTFADAQRTVDISGDSEIDVEFSYSVKWNPSVTAVRFLSPACLPVRCLAPSAAVRGSMCQATHSIEVKGFAV